MFLNQISLRKRMFVISIAPLLITTCIMLFVVFNQLGSLMQGGVASARSLIMESKQQELKNLVDMAFHAVKPIYDAEGEMAEAVRILQQINYGEDGYMFGFDKDSIQVFRADLTEGIGKSFKNSKDANGVYTINELVKAGMKNGLGTGNHFVQYQFATANSRIPQDKLGYAIYLDKWDLMIGTAINISSIESSVDVFRTGATGARNRIITFIVIVATIVFTGMLFISVLVVNSILVPLKRVSSSLSELCEGNGDLTQRIPVEDKFETGELALRLNALLNTLQVTMRGVFDVATDVKKETDGLTQIADSVREVSQEQAAQVEIIANSTTEMASTSTEVAANGQKAAETAQTADEHGKQAIQTAERSRAEMAHLVEDLTRSSDVVTEVGKDVENISAILQVIESIAEQTNLLALNAAIEAARAGEQGRGFAVVADEVRNLASKTQGSTEEIKQMISKLQSGARAAVEVMQQSINRSDSAESSVQATSHALQEITSAISLITDMNVQIASAANEQSTVGQDINERMLRASERTSKLSGIADENNQAASHLIEKTKELDAIVNNFKL